MAYYTKLDNDKQSKIYKALQAHISSEAQSLYFSALSKAKTKKQIEACAGQYKGEWYELLDGWLKDEISNLHIYACLSNGIPIAAQSSSPTAN